MLFGYAAISGSAAVALATYADPKQHLDQIALTGSLSVGLLTVGLITALRSSNGERALASFERELKLGHANGARAFAETDAWLERMATRERRRRKVTLWLTQSIALFMAVNAAVLLLPRADASRDEQALTAALLGSGAAMISSLGLVIGLRETPTEHMLKLYRIDQRPQLGLGPSVSRTSLGLSLSGRF